LRVAYSNVSENDVVRNGIEEGAKVSTWKNEAWEDNGRKASVISMHVEERECGDATYLAKFWKQIPRQAWKVKKCTEGEDGNKEEKEKERGEGEN
ncbi:hypothetical protein KI387_041907, partial [Taxus chinensis]